MYVTNVLLVNSCAMEKQMEEEEIMRKQVKISSYDSLIFTH